MRSVYSEIDAFSAGAAWPWSLRQTILAWCSQSGESGYWCLILFWIALGGILGANLIRRIENKKIGSYLIALFMAIFSLTLLLLIRLPTFMLLQLSTDEDFFIAGIMSVIRHRAYFEVLDGTTSGPLNFVLPAALSYIGIPINTVGIRIFALLTHWVVIQLLFNLLRQLIGTRISFYLCFVYTVLISCITHPGWIFYTSEHLSLMFIGCLLCLLAEAEFRQRFSIFSLITIIILITLFPFTKLQAIPFLPLFLSWTLLLIWRKCNSEWSFRIRLLCSLSVLAAATVPLSYVYIQSFYTPSLNRFWISYVETSRYASNTMAQSFLGRFTVFWSMFKRNLDLSIILAVSVLSTLPILFSLRRNYFVGQKSSSYTIVGVVLAIGMGLISAITPGRDFTHYLQYFFIPLWLGTSIITAILSRELKDGGNRVIRKSVLLAPCIGLLGVLAPPLINGNYAFYLLKKGLVPDVNQTFVSQVISSFKQADDTLSVWGWCSQIHLQAQIIPASRDVLTERHIIDFPVQPLYRSWYMEDLKTEKPAFFVDSVGSHPCGMGYSNRATQGHETFSELHEFVVNNYQFLYDQEGLRLYISYERLLSYFDEAHLFPLISYLRLTELGSSAYADFDKLFSSFITLEKEPARVGRKYPQKEMTKIFQNLTNKTLALLVNDNKVSSLVAKDVFETAEKVTAQLYDNNHQSRLIEIQNPIQKFVALAESWRSQKPH